MSELNLANECDANRPSWPNRAVMMLIADVLLLLSIPERMGNGDPVLDLGYLLVRFMIEGLRTCS